MGMTQRALFHYVENKNRPQTQVDFIWLLKGTLLLKTSYGLPEATGLS